MQSTHLERPPTADGRSNDGSLSSDHIVLDSSAQLPHTWQSSSTEGGRGPPPDPGGPVETHQGERRSALGAAAASPVPQWRLPTRQRADVSDSNIRSPWARKTVLTLDGGGIKGYSTLLILKRLIKLVGEIEGRRRPAGYHDMVASTHRKPYFHEINTTSADYPWFRAEGDPYEPRDEHLAASEEGNVTHDEESNDEIEETSKQSVGASDYLPHHYFDYIAGTSAGGLSALMLGRLRMSIDQALAQYDVIGNRVFAKPRPLHRQFGLLKHLHPKYPSQNMENALLGIIDNGLKEELFQWGIKAGEAPLESDQAQCRTIAVSYADPVFGQTKQDYMFRSYDHPAPSPLAQAQDEPLNPGRAHREPIFKIARATSAAPGYFAPISFSGSIFRDGGMGANNPAHLTLWEVEQMHEQPPRLLLSLGTGMPEDVPVSGKTLEKLRRFSEKKREKKEREPRIKKGLIKTMADINDAVALATESERTEERVRRECRITMPQVEYYRMNVETGMVRIPMDEWQPAVDGTATKAKITQLTNRYLRNKEVNSRLLQCARTLVNLRRARAKTERWERFATNYVYFCPHPTCNSPDNRASKTYLERKELREHGINEHFAVLGTPIKNGLGYTIACTHDVCVRQVHIFNDTEELRRHFHEHHDGLSDFKNDVEIEAWLDMGRKSRPEALLHRESMRYRKMLFEGVTPGAATVMPTAAGAETQPSTAPPSLRSRRTGSTLRFPIKFRRPWADPDDQPQPQP